MNFTDEQVQYFHFLTLIDVDITTASQSEEYNQKYAEFTTYWATKCIGYPIKKAFKRWTLKNEIQQEITNEMPQAPSTHPSPQPQLVENPQQIEILEEYNSPIPWEFNLNNFDVDLLAKTISPIKIPPQPPQPQQAPPQQQQQTPTAPISPILSSPHLAAAKKDLSKIKPPTIKKRKRENEYETKTVGRPTRFETLSRIANQQTEPLVFSQSLVLCNKDGRTKRSKTIFSKNQKDIECFNEKQFVAFDFLTEERKLCLETIKKEKEKLKRLDNIEEILKETNKIKTINNKLPYTL